MNHVIIVGAGQGAIQSAQSLRTGGHDGAITILGNEGVPPYQRPPLSKAFMKGEIATERLWFKPERWFADNHIDTRFGAEVTKILCDQLQIVLSTGERLSYNKLIIATGSRPRALLAPGVDRPNVFVLRSIADVERIRPNLQSGARLVVVGAGYIGLEAAAVAAQLGVEVTVIEMADRILARVTSPEMSSFFEEIHRGHGVKILTGASVTSLNESEGTVCEVVIGSDKCIPADIVLVGIGILPNTELAEAAGLTCENGILVDEDAQTSDANIYAIGDCANRPLVHYGRRGRLESVHNAIEQAKLAAASILNTSRPPEEVPWFWSDQYDVKLQIVGLQQGYDEIVQRGDMSDQKFSLFYFEGERLIAVDAVNSPQDFMAAKKLISLGLTPDKDFLKDSSRAMIEILRQAQDK